MIEDEIFDDEDDYEENSREWGPAPTQQEIRERCLEVQSTWDEETRINRIVDIRLRPDYEPVWEVPVVKMEDLEGDIESALGEVVDMGVPMIEEVEDEDETEV
jgi:hypothetical protein